MDLQNYLQEAGQLATLAGILAGFAFSAVTQLIAVDKPGKMLTATIIIFATTSLMFLFCLVSFVLIFSTAAELNAIPQELDPVGSVSVVVLMMAIFLFLAGVGVSGWVRSKTTGIATTIFSLITICLTTMLIYSVMTAFSK